MENCSFKVWKARILLLHSGFPGPARTSAPGGVALLPHPGRGLASSQQTPPSHEHLLLQQGGACQCGQTSFLKLLRVTSSLKHGPSPFERTIPVSGQPQASPSMGVIFLGPLQLCWEHESFKEGGVSQCSPGPESQAGHRLVASRGLKKAKNTREEEEEKCPGVYVPPSLPK